MPQRQLGGQKVWKRPLTSIYSDNYRYGNSLYSSALDDIERKYHESMARTQFRSDRPDFGYGSYSSPATPMNLDTDSKRSRRINLETELLDLSRSLSGSRLSPPPMSSGVSQVRKSFSFNAYESAKALTDIETGLQVSRARRQRIRPESGHYVDELLPPSSQHHSRHRSPPRYHPLDPSIDAANQAIWMDRCRQLQHELDRLNGLLLESESKVKTEAVSVKNKLNMEIADLVMILEEQERYNQQLHNSLKKQHRQVLDLQSNYESIQQCYADSMDELSRIQRKASQFGHEVKDLRENMEKAVFKTPSYVSQLSDCL